MFDVVGIGLGPSNLALAIALDEKHRDVPGGINAVFLERQRVFGWHRNMLLPTATMQISFLKDLVTYREPTSRFSFVAFLHESRRLTQFVNKQNFFPTRQEFHEYLDWAAANFVQQTRYGSEVVGLRLPAGVEGPADHVEIEFSQIEDGRREVVRARNVVISTGLQPRMPDGVVRDERVWHSSEFLQKFAASRPETLKCVAVVGAGQSAAEIARFFHDALPDAMVLAIVPSYGYSVADDTPFANQVFDPAAVDDYYYGSAATREAFWRYHRNTNYAVVDGDVIRELHQRVYDESVSGSRRLFFHNLTRVSRVRREGDITRVSLTSLLDDERTEIDVDALVFATGYDSMDPTGLLGDLDRYCLRDDEGRHRVDRDYRLVTGPELACGIYLQGGTEHTHGLSASLLSNIAVRSGEIAESIMTRTSW